MDDTDFYHRLADLRGLSLCNLFPLTSPVLRHMSGLQETPVEVAYVQLGRML